MHFGGHFQFQTDHPAVVWLPERTALVEYLSMPDAMPGAE
jgi:hypothetical protein